MVAFAQTRDLFALPGLAIVLFASTNIDDLLVLVGFFADRSFRAREIVAGQYIGVAALFSVSVAASLLSLVIPTAYVGLLGLAPILIGVRKLVDLRHNRESAELDTPVKPGAQGYGRVASVALVTMANGGDNIGIYMPSFAVHSGREIAVIGAVFFVMIGIWCALAHWMVHHPTLGAPIRRYGHLLAPVVLIGLGLLILYQAGSLGLLLRPLSHG